VPVRTLKVLTHYFATCFFRLIGIPAWGPPQLARWHLQRHLQYISSDDKVLKQEGYGRDLTLPELKEALQERGM
jgi:LETM1 and EF-hand domain-containing protein 1